MFKYNYFFFLLVIAVFLACTRKDNTKLSIQFSKDSSAIEISNIDLAALLQLKNNLATDTLYQKLVSVLETPADDDSTGIEREWSGKLSMNDDKVVFKPDSSFVKGKTYLVETQLNMSFGDIEQMIKGKMKTTMRFQQQLLKR